MLPNPTLAQLRHTLGDAHFPTSFGVYFKNTLVALCHAMEDHILQTEEQPLVITTFQQGKWYLQEAERYRQIANRSQQVVIMAQADSGFGEHPTGQLPNVALVNLAADDCLVNEWNLVILAPTYAAMVLCEELSAGDYGPDGYPERDSERKFYGLWTFEREQVRQAALLLVQQIERYNFPLAAQLHRCLYDLETQKSGPSVDLSSVVSRIVTYLQTSQQQLVAVSRQSRTLRELEDEENRLSRNLTANKLQAFLRMAQRLDGADSHNPNSSLQVSAFCETLGQLLDLPTLNLRRVRLAGLLYRIGLGQAPVALLTTAESEWSDSDRDFFLSHPEFGATLLEAMPELEAVAKIISHQHEHWDGSGRPQGLRGEAIPLESRILSLVAHFQSLIYPRGNRAPLASADALAACQALSGTYFEPRLLESLGHVLKLCEIGLITLPTRPRHMPAGWLGSEWANTAESVTAPS
ncbi:DICT sensory domain-containing protein [Leptolyngbya sp. FACHB-261]|uniref:DICT sensory domain-containing protein n=1 Tax=Leptolyngbya sp. FACHB-261 TaxID=2692806 RepID=UPI001684845E|nr:DICT sensory domain-containing protein [Leptolyngbya sp. FACHB-261]MBD2102862.1 HD domain-containing protein [Leptolyngbya sp. FACHB-261]